MLSVVELFQIGVPGDWVVDWDQAGWVVQILTKRILLGSNSMGGVPDQKSLGGMIGVLKGIGRSLVKGYGKENVMRDPVNVHMTGLVIVIHEKRSTTIETVRGLGTGREGKTGKESMAVTVTVIVVTETGIGTGIAVGTMIEKGTAPALMIAIVRGAGIVVKEIMSVAVTSGTVATCMRGMQTMAMVGQSMTKICPATGRIMAMAIMSNTKVMRHMVMVKMDVVMKLSTQRGMTMSTIVLTRTVKWKPTIRCCLTMLNLKGLRKVRHMRKETTSITELASI
jgi:hypothetical protein